MQDKTALLAEKRKPLSSVINSILKLLVKLVILVRKIKSLYKKNKNILCQTSSPLIKGVEGGPKRTPKQRKREEQGAPKGKFPRQFLWELPPKSNLRVSKSPSLRTRFIRLKPRIVSLWVNRRRLRSKPASLWASPNLVVRKRSIRPKHSLQVRHPNLDGLILIFRF